MDNWTATELALAVKLTSRHGYDFDQSARIMSRNGYPGRTGSQIKEKIRESSPKAWAKISAAYDSRQSIKISGVPASPPRRRYNILSDDFIEFTSNLHLGLTDAEACWAARLAGFNCNITDIGIAAKRAGYEFVAASGASVPYVDAIDDNTCMWPVGDGACGQRRERGRYCGPHHCRSLGGPIR